jgi:hypothetical protein
MKNIFITLLCAAFGKIACSQPGKKIIHAFHNNLTMSVPADVDTMSAKQIQAKYHNIPDGKTIYYANKDLGFSIMLMPVAENIKEADMIEDKDQLIARFTAQGLKIEKSEIKKIAGHRLMIISFYSKAPVERVFNKRVFAVINKELIMVTFNCTASQVKKRMPGIDESVSSIQIKN